MTPFAERLLQIRGSKKQGVFAKELGLNPNTLRAYEEGRSLPNQEVLEQICVKFSVNPAWLLLGVEQERLATDTIAITPKVSTRVCSRCVELLERLVQVQDTAMQTQKQKEALLEENGELKAEIAVLQQRLSPPAATSGESPHAKTA